MDLILHITLTTQLDSLISGALRLSNSSLQAYNFSIHGDILLIHQPKGVDEKLFEWINDIKQNSRFLTLLTPC